MTTCCCSVGFPLIQHVRWFGLNEAATNTEAVMFELQLSVQPVRQGSHQLKARPSTGFGFEIPGEPAPASATSTTKEPSSLASQRTCTFKGNPVGCAYLLALVRSSAVISP